MRFCGGRSIAAIMIITLAYLAISLTESVLFLIFCGTDSLYLGISSLAEKHIEAVYIVSGAALVWIFVIPALILGCAKLYLSFASHIPKKCKLFQNI